MGVGGEEEEVACVRKGDVMCGGGWFKRFPARFSSSTYDLREEQAKEWGTSV